MSADERAPAMSINYLVCCRIPRQDLQGLSCPSEPPHFQDGYVRLDLTVHDAVLIWVNAFDETKTVHSEREALRLGLKMARVVLQWLRHHQPRAPLLQEAVLDA